MRAAGLIAAIHLPIRPGHVPHLLVLTDAGLAAVALDQRVDVGPLVRRNHLRRQDLLALLPGVPYLLGTYELLGALCRARAGRPELLAWQRPWRARYLGHAKTMVVVRAPAYASISWEEEETGRREAGDYLLFPDLADVPIPIHRTVLERLLRLRHAQGGWLPGLVVATSDRGRREAWGRLLDEVCRAAREAPFEAHLATWAAWRSGEAKLSTPPSGATEELVRPVRLRPLVPRQPGRPIPRPVRAPLLGPGPPGPEEPLGLRAAGLSARDRALLDLIGRHPYLSAAELAAVLGWQTGQVRCRLSRLIGFGLARLLDEEELVELTGDGLLLVAAQLGLSLAVAIRCLGLSGGGPEHPCGTRAEFLRNLPHTRGVNALFCQLYQVIRHRYRPGEGVLEWRSAAVFRRAPIVPDGYGLVRYRGQLAGFFLEYDRGTMSRRDYRRKLRAYCAYLESGRFERDYQGFPWILFVTTDPSAGERIACAVREVRTGRFLSLPVLIAAEWRVVRDPGNSLGLLGRVWQEPDSQSVSPTFRPLLR